VAMARSSNPDELQDMINRGVASAPAGSARLAPGAAKVPVATKR
jgi:hypothetical protein